MSADMIETPSELPLFRIQMAKEVLAARLQPSPCIEVQDGRHQSDRLYVKAENLMPTGSFKIRGATFRISLLTEEERRQGVIAYSTGNHAQAVAKAAQDEGVSFVVRSGMGVCGAGGERDEIRLWKRRRILMPLWQYRGQKFEIQMAKQ